MMKTLDVLAWICMHERCVLVVRTRGRDRWYLPGGKREAGESDAAALARELREEIGVELLPDTLQSFAIVEDDTHGITPPCRVRMHCYLGEVRGAPQPLAEIEALEWFGVADAAHCAPAAQQVLLQLAARQLID